MGYGLVSVALLPGVTQSVRSVTQLWPGEHVVVIKDFIDLAEGLLP